MKLSPKRQRFVEEYLKDQNGTQAYIRAGYAPNGAKENASRLIAIDTVRLAIDKGLARITSGIEDEIDDLRRYWVEVRKDKDLPTRDRLKASELSGKHHGAFVDKLEIEAEIAVNLVKLKEL